jgi:hypothetical protein
MGTSTLVATAKSSTANSYCTLAEADQYQDDRPAVSTTWADASENNKIRALLWATQLMESLFNWNGYASTTTQALGWPRQGLLERIDVVLDSDTVPSEVKDAQSEYARQLLVTNRAQDNDIEAQSISSIKAGSVALVFDSSAAYNKVVPDAVYLQIPQDWFSSVRGRLTGTRILERAS